ncbi:hypothetical protein B0J11DRAFT_62108 [Dendryphion nanum]|uniref:Uncharacterized protein n=1 Tax=Dendryphion nanum TaxID=256645 RepID=A0A9P9IID0_9PLEO|nr:hypothetical protein B0J11DRAFT_62108 [Dendryphion nanum]
MEPRPARMPTEFSLRGDKKLKRVQTTVSDFGRHNVMPHSKQTSAQHQSSAKSHPKFMNKLARTFTEPTKNILRREFHWNWSWEICGALLSIVCTTLMASIFFSMNERPLSHWKLPIQPNSLIAVFSTVAKSALLVPVTECISQLKWIYFEKRHPLSHMQVFDDASRGPWGSLVLLQKVKLNLGTLGAVITILALTLEPFTQQVLDFPLRNSEVKNATGFVGGASSWSDTALESNIKSSVQLAFNYGIISQTAGKPSVDPVYGCDTPDCRFGDFLSLAVCTTCESSEISEDDEISCQFSASTSATAPRVSNTTYQLKTSNRTELQAAAKVHNFVKQETNCTFTKTGFPPMSLYIESNLRNVNNQTEIKVTSRSWHFGVSLTSDGEIPFTKTTGGRVSEKFQICRGWDYHREMNDTDTIERFSCFSMRPDYTNVKSTADFMRNTHIRGNVSWCSLKLCAREFKQVKLQNGQVIVNETRNIPLSQDSVNGSDVIAIGENPNKKFAIGKESRRRLSFLIRNATMAETTAMQDIFAPYLADHTWPDLYHCIADVYTSIFRSYHNVNLVKIRGKAYSPQTFVKVRWEWFVMPLVIVFLSLSFMVFTILQSHRRDHLFKSSILAALFHGLDGWKKSDLWTTRHGERERARALQHRANVMSATLTRDRDGFFKFMKQD